MVEPKTVSSSTTQGALAYRAFDNPYQCRLGAKCLGLAKPLKTLGQGFNAARQAMIRMAGETKNPSNISRLECHSENGSTTARAENPNDISTLRGKQNHDI